MNLEILGFPAEDNRFQCTTTFVNNALMDILKPFSRQLFFSKRHFVVYVACFIQGIKERYIGLLCEYASVQ